MKPLFVELFPVLLEHLSLGNKFDFPAFEGTGFLVAFENLTTMYLKNAKTI